MARLIDLGDGSFRLEGDLDLRAVGDLARTSARLFRRRGSPAREQASISRIDLSGVTKTSSAAVALMVDWMARAQSNGNDLRIHNWPESMVRIARLSNLAELLGLPEQGGAVDPP